MKKRISKKELIKRIDYMLNNSEYDKVLYFYRLIGLVLGVFKLESEV